MWLGSDVAACRGVLAAALPALRIERVDWLGEGLMNRAFLVNGTHVFRFPKNEHAAQDLQREIALLPELAPCLSLPVPRFEFVGQSADGLPFAGYPMLPGELLSRAAVAELAPPVRDCIAEQLAQFLDELHAFAPERALALGAHRLDLEQKYRRLRGRVRAHAADLPRVVLAYLERRFETFLADGAASNRPGVLLHGDVGPAHWLFDRGAGKLCGIIDFGDLAVGDPDYDYLHVLGAAGSEFARALLRRREEPDVEATLHKVAFFVTFDHAYRVVTGSETGPREWVTEGLAELAREAATAAGGAAFPDDESRGTPDRAPRA